MEGYTSGSTAGNFLRNSQPGDLMYQRGAGGEVALSGAEDDGRLLSNEGRGACAVGFQVLPPCRQRDVSMSSSSRSSSSGSTTSTSTSNIIRTCTAWGAGVCHLGRLLNDHLQRGGQGGDTCQSVGGCGRDTWQKWGAVEVRPPARRSPAAPPRGRRRRPRALASSCHSEVRAA